jgi:uncharacterized protein YggE
MLKQTMLLLAIGAFANGAASAQTPGALTPGTVELKISAAGQSVKPADYVTVYVPISTNGDTAPAARAANSAAIATLTSALVAHGVDRDAITLLPPSGRMGFVGNEAYDLSDGPLVPQAMTATMARKKSASSIVRIRLTNITLFDRVREVLDQQNLATLGAPLYALDDDRAAKNAAVAEAIGKAKQDAEAYAVPLGLRVERITSVSNYGDAASVVPDANFIMQMVMGTQDVAPGSVTTRVQVWVNFVLSSR